MQLSIRLNETDVKEAIQDWVAKHGYVCMDKTRIVFLDDNTVTAAIMPLCQAKPHLTESFSEVGKQHL